MRVHNASLSELVLRDVDQDGYGLKPLGLWYSIGDSWIEWCRSEMPDWVKPHNFILDLDMSRVLLIASKSDIVDFQRRYGASVGVPGVHLMRPDWRRVAKDYCGIEVNPYFRDLSFTCADYLWYYGWDVPSGCVWDKSAVKSVKLMKGGRDVEVRGLPVLRACSG